MNALEFYMSDLKDPSLLKFRDGARLGLDALDWAPTGISKESALVIEADRSLLWGAARRISPDGHWFEFASLSGCIRVSTEGIDARGPIDIFLAKNGGSFQCSYAFGDAWMGYCPDGLVRMRALVGADGARRPLANARSFRGHSSKGGSCLVWLPEAPSRVEKTEAGALLTVDGRPWLVEGAAGQAIHEDWATWVLPNREGWFEAPPD